MPGETEYELKFRVDAEAISRVLDHPLLRQAAAYRRVERLVSTYFDTGDERVRANRFALRVREGGLQTVHTLKRSKGSSVSRGEWEQTNDAPRPDPAWLRRTPLQSLLDDGASALEPRFAVDVERTVFPLDYRGAEIEVAIDRGTIRAAGRSLPVSEVELELKQGREEAVWHLARRLVSDLPMVLALSSKSERGYELAEERSDEIVRKIRPQLDRRMELADAFAAIVETCLRAFLKNAALIGTDDDIEAVHRTRTALRHLRAACQLFRPALRRKRLTAIETTVKRLSRQLGAARDLDVFQQQVFAPLARQPAIPGARALGRLMEEDRRHAHGDLRASLASREARLAALDLLAFAADGVRRSQRTRAFRPVVRRMFARRRAALARETKGLGRMSAGAMHGIRKSAKMLRYDLDLLHAVRRLGRGARAKALSRDLSILQDRLGAIHDDQAMRSHVANHVLARFARNPSAVDADQRKAVAAAVHLCFRQADRSRDLKKARRAARRLRAFR